MGVYGISTTLTKEGVALIKEVLVTGSGDGNTSNGNKSLDGNSGNGNGGKSIIDVEAENDYSLRNDDGSWVSVGILAENNSSNINKNNNINENNNLGGSKVDDVSSPSTSSSWLSYLSGGRFGKKTNGTTANGDD